RAAGKVRCTARVPAERDAVLRRAVPYGFDRASFDPQDGFDAGTDRYHGPAPRGHRRAAVLLDAADRGQRTVLALRPRRRPRARGLRAVRRHRARTDRVRRAEHVVPPRAVAGRAARPTAEPRESLRPQGVSE